MDFRKEIARPGTYTYLNPAGQPERMTLTAETLKHFHTQGNAMLRDGLSIPVPLEHQPDAKPQTASQRAATQLVNNAGFVKGFEITAVKNDAGTLEDRLFSVLDIPDPEIIKKLPTTIRSVSPWINSFTDGNGKHWDGVISHVALTTRPRIAKQAPFETVGAAMSLMGSLQDRVFSPLSKLDINLSSAGLLTKKTGGFAPKFPVAFSLMTGIKLSSESLHDAAGKFAKTGKRRKKKKKTTSEMEAEGDAALKKQEANERHSSSLVNKMGSATSAKMSADDELADDEEWEDDDSDGEGDAEGGGEADATDQFAKDNEMPGMETEAGDVSFEELIPHLLEMHGIHVPAGGKGKDFLQALVRGLLASAKQMASTDGGADDTVLGDKPDPMDQNKPAKPPGPVTQESPPMYMSLEEIKKIADPKERAVASKFFSMEQELQSHRKNILDEAARIRQARVDRLLKRIPAAARDKVVRALAAPGAMLSLENGIVTDPMAVMLEVFEAGIPDLPTLLVHGVKMATEQPQPTDGEMTDARAQEVADKQMGRRATVPA